MAMETTSILLFYTRVAQVLLAPFELETLHVVLSQHLGDAACSLTGCTLNVVDRINLTILAIPLIAGLLTITIPLMNIIRACFKRRECFTSGEGQKPNGLRFAFEEAMIVLWLLAGVTVLQSLGTNEPLLVLVGYVEVMLFVTSTAIVDLEEKDARAKGTITLSEKQDGGVVESFQSGDIFLSTQRTTLLSK